jgi:LPXTG-motif cell wall-anchored protein
MKQERIVYKNGKFPNDVRNVVVSDYKDVLSIGNSVMIEGKKWIVIAKEDSKCVVMDMLGNIKSSIIETLYPVGSIYTSMNNIDPSTFIGGTWTPIKDEDNDGVADEEDDFVITWDNAAGTWADGSADAVKTETKNYGESLTAPGVVAPVDHVFSGWSPAVDKVTKTVTYVAQYTKDSIYTITYKVDGNTYVVDGKEQVFYVNATDGEIVPSVAAPSKDGYKFTVWTNADVIGTVPTADVTLEATWAVDANRNGVADGNETAQVTLTVSEGGTATLTNGDNDKIIITNTYTPMEINMPQTGDESDILLWLSLALSSMTALVLISRKMREA